MATPAYFSSQSILRIHPRFQTSLPTRNMTCCLCSSPDILCQGTVTLDDMVYRGVKEMNALSVKIDIHPKATKLS